MGKNDDLSILTKELHQVFVWLTKKCLAERPKDVQRFCLDKLASKLGHRVLEGIPCLSREVSLLQSDNVSEFMNDVQLAKHESKHFPTGFDKQLKFGYVSSSDDSDGDEAEPVILVSNPDDDDSHAKRHHHETGSSTGNSQHVKTRNSHHSGKESVNGPNKKETLDKLNSEDKSAAEVTYINDEDDESEGIVDDDDDDDDDGNNKGGNSNIEFFKTDTFKNDELGEMVKQYEKDKRMIQLFEMWDGDSSGAIDFVELVMALHKFEQVAAAGVDIKVAADALVEFVESDTERELKLPQFTKVIVVFAKNLFDKSFDEVADHMLKVAQSTSEAAVLHAASGKDVSDIIAIDKEELQLMKETAECVSVSVENNICRLRTMRGGGVPGF